MNFSPNSFKIEYLSKKKIVSFSINHFFWWFLYHMLMKWDHLLEFKLLSIWTFVFISLSGDKLLCSCWKKIIVNYLCWCFFPPYSIPDAFVLVDLPNVDCLWVKEICWRQYLTLFVWIYWKREDGWKKREWKNTTVASYIQWEGSIWSLF